MDKIIFNGNIGRDCDYTEKDGHGMARFSVAVQHVVKGNKETEWRSVTAFGKQAEFLRDYAKKGRAVIVEGRPSPRTYKNKLEETVAVIDVLADRVDLIGSKQDGAEQAGTAPSAPAQPVVVDDESDLPF